MEVEIPAEEKAPLLGRETIYSRLGTDEMPASSKWPEDTYDISVKTTAFGVKGDAIGKRSRSQRCRIFKQLKFALFDSHWPLSCFLAVAFLGVWLPKKSKSLWLLTLIPVFHMLFGLGAHMYFILLARDQNTLKVHIGSKILLTSLWISGFSSYILALYYFRYQSQEWRRGLSKIQRRAVNVGLFTGLLLVSWVLFLDAHYQVMFDLEHIKKALTHKCPNLKACNGVWYPLVTSIYWGMYSSIAVCCVFFSLCLAMTNDLTRGYHRLTKCNGNVRNAVIMHKQVHEQIGEKIICIRVWFLVHTFFYLVVFLASVFDWWEAASDSLHSVAQYMAQISGTLVVVYKFFFPFLSASYVTWHESTLVQDMNDKTDYLPGETFHSRQDLEVFFAQSKRRGYGFRLFKIQITITIAIFSLLGSGFGLLHALFFNSR
ncbi:uncharacterized protein LOC111345011 [Stylophora pistillata]|uniref:uncharacterized protein LOC111345011 n=1 Tax=Stylophora pistillata TaxID=50429 RepID=UPI000C04FADC|nr:uncharacterized protein LOC111345011 [Stylophora pistillata]